jgi:hypothetical protein
MSKFVCGLLIGIILVKKTARLEVASRLSWVVAGQDAKLFAEYFAEMLEVGKADGIGNFRDGQA